MKEVLRQMLESTDSQVARSGLIREYLQARVLEALQDGEVFLRWAFLGGTALRFLFSIPRFSENLDFSVIRSGSDPGLGDALAGVERLFRREQYAYTIRSAVTKAVVTGWISFPGLPYEMGISPLRQQSLRLKIEVDANPPPGAGIQTTLVRRHVVLNLCHYDKASLLAGKLHAVLTRPWTKGRDLYDIVWYLSDRTWPPPNLVLLNAALAQSGWTGPPMTNQNWRVSVWSRLASIDWTTAQADVRPFLERDRDWALVTPEVLSSLLEVS